MISSIFGKTKPINHIIVLTILFVLYWIVQFLSPGATFSPSQLVFKTFVLSILLFSVFLVNFIAKRNKMTGPNSFAMLFYGLLMFVFTETFVDDSAIFCSFFILLATRRLISLRSLKDMKLKIFDATLWILIASLFYEWVLLFLVLVFAAIYIYEPKNIRNWLVPFSSIFVFFMIGYGILTLIGHTAFFQEHYGFELKFDLSYFLHWENSAKLIIYIIMVLVAAVISFLKLGKKGIGKIVTMRLAVLTFILGILMNMLVVSPGSDPLMVTFFPAAIFFANYVETINRQNIKEIVLMVSVLVPFLIFIFDVLI
ncbi:DUF6427 family protein [Maribacter algicola]|uniref:DUF6427 family protein n=1 Tax=Meishania litoralis TaxID=3434685 RepID=A0ACC7LIJ8_9FLAO